MEDSKLTGLLVSFFYEGSVLQEVLQRTQRVHAIQNFEEFISKLMMEKCASSSELHAVSNLVNNLLNVRNQTDVASNLPFGYFIVAKAVFASLLSLPCFLTWEPNNGDYFLTIPIPTAAPIEFVRTSRLIDQHIKSGVLKKAPSPALILQLLRQGGANVFPSFEIQVEANLNGQQNGRQTYVLQTVICLNGANDLVTYIREGTNVSDRKWKFIKQSEWNHFSVHDLPDFEKHVQFVNNLKNLEHIPIEMTAMHSLFIMANSLFLVYAPAQHNEDILSEAVASVQLNDQADSPISGSQTEATQPSNPTQIIPPPYALETMDSLLSMMESHCTIFRPILEGIKEKVGGSPGTDSNELDASHLVGYIDWTNVTSSPHPQFYVFWRKLTQLALGIRFGLMGGGIIMVHDEEAPCLTIQQIHNSHEHLNTNNPFGLAFSLRRTCGGMQGKSIRIDTQLFTTDATDEAQTLKLIYVICFLEGVGIIAYLFDAPQKCWMKGLPNGNIHNLEQVTNLEGFLEFAHTEESAQVPDTQIAQEHSIGLVYAHLA